MALSPQQRVDFARDDLAALFRLFELDENGNVNIEDIGFICHEFGLEDLYSDIYELLSGIKGRGQPISPTEIENYLFSVDRCAENELGELFDELDHERRGNITAQTLRMATRDLLAAPLSKAEAAAMIALLADGGTSLSRDQIFGLAALKPIR